MKSKLHAGKVLSLSCCYLAVAHVKYICLFQEARRYWKGCNCSGCSAVVLMLMLRGIWGFFASQSLELVDYVEIRIYLAGSRVKMIFNPCDSEQSL